MLFIHVLKVSTFSNVISPVNPFNTSNLLPVDTFRGREVKSFPYESCYAPENIRNAMSFPLLPG